MQDAYITYAKLYICSVTSAHFSAIVEMDVCGGVGWAGSLMAITKVKRRVQVIFSR